MTQDLWILLALAFAPVLLFAGVIALAWAERPLWDASGYQDTSRGTDAG